MDRVERYLELALTPDIDGLARLLDAAVAADGPTATYDRLIQPALDALGARWERDEITVADEHLVTALTEQLLADIHHRGSGVGPVAVVASTPDNEHRVGAGMVADALRHAGWQVQLLASGSDYAEIVRACTQHGAGLLALSAGLELELAELDDDLVRLREAVGEHTTILVGGGPVLRRPDWRGPDDVIVCTCAEDALREGRRRLPATEGAR
jgi:MerR family transcriptional regulator, light-induced transcriptional regulator